MVTNQPPELGNLDGRFLFCVNKLELSIKLTLQRITCFSYCFLTIVKKLLQYEIESCFINIIPKHWTI